MSDLHLRKQAFEWLRAQININGDVLPRNLLQKGLSIEGNRIIDVGNSKDLAAPPGTRAVDARGLSLVPGFIDLQVNGGFGQDFAHDPESIWDVADQLPRYGVTTFLPTLITSPKETVETALKVLAQEPPAGFSGAIPLGMHLEGPFLNTAKKGAHNAAYLRSPATEYIANWSPETGVRLVTLAPELP